eukprot:SAG31_NODE_42845_length_269_cov_2.129412_1_plen_59_part_10
MIEQSLPLGLLRCRMMRRGIDRVAERLASERGSESAEPPRHFTPRDSTPRYIYMGWRIL